MCFDVVKQFAHAVHRLLWTGLRVVQVTPAWAVYGWIEFSTFRNVLDVFQENGKFVGVTGRGRFGQLVRKIGGKDVGCSGGSVIGSSWIAKGYKLTVS